MDAPPYSAAAVDVLRLPAGATERDRVAVEEPLEIRIAGRPVAVTMRTPGHDEELALGFCLSEGLKPREARLPDDLAANRVEVDAPGFDPARLQRSFYTSSSCGVCGKGALEAIAVEAPRVESELQLPLAVVASLPDRLREAQAAFEATGGLHATGLFSAAGEPLCVREDVGRHNAMDKVIGWAYREQLLPLARHVLCVSGRLSFELVQKAAVAGCPVLVAVGAPSSLAVDLAADRGVTLCGFVRGGASSRFGSPKAFAEFEGATLAERAWALLAEVCGERIAVGRLEGLPFPALEDEGTGPVAAIAAGLRDATRDVAVVIPVDMPLLTPDALRLLADVCRDAAVAQAGPLPCAVARSALPAFETGERRLRTVLDGLDTAPVELDPSVLANVNTRSDLDTLAP